MEETRLYKLIEAMQKNALAIAKTSNDEQLAKTERAKALELYMVLQIMTDKEFAEDIAKIYNI